MHPSNGDMFSRVKPTSSFKTAALLLLGFAFFVAVAEAQTGCTCTPLWLSVGQALAGNPPNTKFVSHRVTLLSLS